MRPAGDAAPAVLGWLLDSGDPAIRRQVMRDLSDASAHASFHTTICVLEALLAHERAGGGGREVTDARLRGQEYLLARRLLRRRSTGALRVLRWSGLGL